MLAFAWVSWGSDGHYVKGAKLSHLSGKKGGIFQQDAVGILLGQKNEKEWEEKDPEWTFHKNPSHHCESRNSQLPFPRTRSYNQ